MLGASKEERRGRVWKYQNEGLYNLQSTCIDKLRYVLHSTGSNEKGKKHRISHEAMNFLSTYAINSFSKSISTVHTNSIKEFYIYFFYISCSVHRNILWNNQQMSQCAHCDICWLFHRMHVICYVTNELTNYIHGAEGFLRSQQFLSQSRNSQNFIEPSSSLLCPQVPALCLCLGRFKVVIVIRGNVKHFVTRGFLQ